MLDQEDLKWIAATSTDLNSILQQVARYADLARRHRGEHNYIDLLGERVELASKTAQSLFDRVTSKILAGAAKNQRRRAKAKPALPLWRRRRPMTSRVARFELREKASQNEHLIPKPRIEFVP